jgi:hypothetical protein
MNYRGQEQYYFHFIYWKRTVTKGSHMGMALGNDKFKDELDNLTGRRLHNLPPSRKLGWRKKII